MKIALLLAAVIILSSGAGIGMHTVPDKAATQATENESVEGTLRFPESVKTIGMNAFS